MSNGSEHLRSTIVYAAPCPTCGTTVTWFHRPQEPWPIPACPRPTCNTHKVIEK